MSFKEFKMKFQAYIKSLLKDQKRLFVTDTDPDALWEMYLESFPIGTNEVFRERREYDCSCCRQFIRSFGNVVVLTDDYKMASIWDFQTDSPTYQPVVNSLARLVKSAPVRDVFVTEEAVFGLAKNHEQLEDGTIRTREHFYYKLPSRFINSARKSVGTIAGIYRTNKEVFQRSLEEISAEDLETVLELIAQKSLYKGEGWEGVLKSFLRLQGQYFALTDEEQKSIFCWVESAERGGAVSKIKNRSIGVLLSDISDGMDLNHAK